MICSNNKTERLLRLFEDNTGNFGYYGYCTSDTSRDLQDPTLCKEWYFWDNSQQSWTLTQGLTVCNETDSNCNTGIECPILDWQFDWNNISNTNLNGYPRFDNNQGILLCSIKKNNICISNFHFYVHAGNCANLHCKFIV